MSTFVAGARPSWTATRLLLPVRALSDWQRALMLAGGIALLWSLAFATTYRAPEIDSAEQFVWSFSMENGYWKHPPLPSWIMHVLVGTFGTSVALPFVATQACVAIAMLILWRLGCQWMSPRRSLAAMALTTLVTYHNLGADCFNHNTVLLPLQAATLWSFHRALRAPAWHRFALAGLCAGLTMLVKYVALWPLLAMVACMAIEQRWRTVGHWRGLAVAAAVFAAVLVPHLLWLQRTDFLPFHYARSVAQALPGWRATLWTVASFVAMQSVRLVPFAIGSWLSLRKAAPSARPAPVDRSEMRFLWINAAAPLALTIATSLLTQTELQSRWGANAFMLSGWLLMTHWPREMSAVTLKRVCTITIGMHLVLCLTMTLSKTVLAEHLHWRTRANYPGDVLASLAQRTWRAQTSAPLRIVVSDIWLGGNIIANSPQRVAVLIDGRRIYSPWVRDGALRDCGALVLDDQTPFDSSARQRTLDALMQRADDTGIWELPWAGSPALHQGSPGGTVRWGVILPRPGAHCDLR